ncbi:Uncharacterised protein [Sphingobacterium spiritivorum]|uniref:Ig-like domain-containing protein n=1 Tax=Sphingobacterium spiritivorum TaxID=258 RepID=A0A380B9T7_SPHSI|nr:hypothetical protein [Sphingobacterium spiritivorum]SUI97825.1 Uncharacterised protein [Sphingobacterium spiritivorum]
MTQVNLNTHNITFRTVLKMTVLAIAFFFMQKTADAQFTITENFKGAVSPDIILGDDSKLTSGQEDPVGAGWLRLTPDDQNKKGYAFINKTFPSSLGIIADFEYKIWRTKDGRGGLNDGGDGFSIFLFDGTTTASQFALGGYGGSLGYARNKEAPSNNNGLKNGYIGIGFDAFGNFTNKYAPDKFTGANQAVPNSITLRGSTGTADNATSNPFLKSVNISGTGTGTKADVPANYTGTLGNGWQNHIDYNKSSGTSAGSYPTSRPTDGVFYRRVQLEVIPVAGNKYNITLRWKREGQTDFEELITYTTTEAPPAILKLGFAASTGWAVNFHELRNLLVTTPGNLRVVKRADKDVLRSIAGTGSENKVTYTIEVVNDTDADLTKIDFKDKITDGAGNLVTPDMFTINSISYSGFLAGTTLPSTSATNEFTGSLNLAKKTTGRITVTGTLNKIPVGNILTNTTNVMPTDITDQDLENNTSVVNTPVIAEDVDLTLLSNVPDACIDPGAGNNFEIKVVNKGNQPTTTANRIVVTKVIPSNVTFTQSASDYSGWTRSVSGFTYTYTATLSLGLGIVAPNPIKYNLKPNSGVTTYTDQTSVKYLSGTSTNTTELEPVANRGNNSLSIIMVAPPVAPVANTPVYYCIGETAVPLTATASGSNTLRWYTQTTGVPLANAPTPSTTTAGTFTYYVSQTNGNCEGPMTPIQVIVQPVPTAGSIGTDQIICENSVPQLITSVQNGTIAGNTTLTYRWEQSIDGGSTWNNVAGTSSTLQPGKLNKTTQFRRITVSLSAGHTCESGFTNVVTIRVKNCKVITNPILINKARRQ